MHKFLESLCLLLVNSRLTYQGIYLCLYIGTQFPLVNIQRLEAKANYIHVKYDPPVILYIGQAQFMGYSHCHGNWTGCAHIVTIEVVNIHIIKTVMQWLYTSTVTLILMYVTIAAFTLTLTYVLQFCNFIADIKILSSGDIYTQDTTFELYMNDREVYTIAGTKLNM